MTELAATRETLTYEIAKRIWDSGEAEYWDYESDRREFDPADASEGYLDETQDPRAMARDVLQQVREVIDAVFESGVLRDADEVRREAPSELGGGSWASVQEEIRWDATAELRAAIAALIDDGHVDLNQLRDLLADDGAALREVKAHVWDEGSDRMYEWLIRTLPGAPEPANPYRNTAGDPINAAEGIDWSTVYDDPDL